MRTTEPSAVTTLRVTLDRCVSDKTATRRAACNKMGPVCLTIHKLADYGGTPTLGPLELREAAVACFKVAQLVRLRDARDFDDLMGKPMMKEALKRARLALHQLGAATHTVVPKKVITKKPVQESLL